MFVELKLLSEVMRRAHPVSCAVCGPTFVPGAVIAYAYSNDGRLDFGAVCPKCLEGGPEEMAKQLEAQAEWTREEADQVEMVAAEAITAPTIEHLRQLEEIAAL